MLRRLLAAVLVASLAVPFPALATGCRMNEPMISAEACDCCTSPAAVAGGCASAMLQAGCGCTLRADAGSQPASPAAAASSSPVSFAIDIALIPAALSTPQRSSRDVDLAASPPGAGAMVSRPRLCSWII